MSTQGASPRREVRGRRDAAKVLPGDARAHNRSLVLQGLFDEGPMSRADLARHTGLTRVTISELVASLIDDGLVAEVGTRTESRQGKPATLVDLAPDGPVVIAIDLSGDHLVTGALVDLGGAILARQSKPIVDLQYAVADVIEVATALVGLSTRPVLGIGIGTPGIVDAAGAVVVAPNLGWENVELAKRVSSWTGLPTYVQNDANAATLAEGTFGEGDNNGLFLVTIGAGVGGGVLIDGRPLVGPLQSSGEIGHVVVEPDGPECACGNHGCLETYLSANALRQADEEGRRRAGQLLGTVITPVVTTLGIADVVFYGDADVLDGPVIEATRQALAFQTLPFVAQRIQVRQVARSAEHVLTGAAAHVRYQELGVV
ncbi:ROK family transcriptional regulator [Branchiibius sp. NY16-3462-2]|uniref:ROK family transcriptional regulator n=1 Tax=Branchiibius sp. NY16-3462-2 TaxID=1807500 RepID=UPI00079625C5|nr:ROK family transcriptional regulator [Branchiibius sp. NY16-3462-2]KYH45057.1 hypothetical protein AZH51_14315 [Branchiibius sp. NY16-3462-2]